MNHVPNCQPVSTAVAKARTPPSQPMQENVQPHVESEQQGKKHTTKKTGKKPKRRPRKRPQLLIMVRETVFWMMLTGHSGRIHKLFNLPISDLRWMLSLLLLLASKVILCPQVSCIVYNYISTPHMFLYLILTHCNLNWNGVGVNTWFKVHH